MSNMLTKQQIDLFKDRGFLVLNDVVNESTIVNLQRRAHNFVNTANLPTMIRHCKGELPEYYLGAGDQIRCYLEKSALDDEYNRKYSLLGSMKKIGHGIVILQRFKQSITLASKPCTISMTCFESSHTNESSLI